MNQAILIPAWHNLILRSWTVLFSSPFPPSNQGIFLFSCPCISALFLSFMGLEPDFVAGLTLCTISASGKQGSFFSLNTSFRKDDMNLGGFPFSTSWSRLKTLILNLRSTNAACSFNSFCFCFRKWYVHNLSLFQSLFCQWISSFIALNSSVS